MKRGFRHFQPCHVRGFVVSGAMSLTPKQEAFAVAVAAGNSLSDAYREAYDAKAMKAETINRKATELMKDGKITARVAELRKPAAEAAQVTLQWHIDELKRLKALAEQALSTCEKPGEVAVLLGQAIKAQQAIGKDSGVAVEKSQIDHTTAGEKINLTVNFVDP